MRQGVIAVILLGLVICCCESVESDRHKRIRDYVAKFIGQELVLPSDTSCHLFGKSYGVNTLNTDYLIVSYIDTDGCTPCHLRLPYWKELNYRLDTLSDIYATTLLVIRPDTLDKVIDFLSRADYDYPIIVDTAGIWTNRNDLPEEKSLHCFLIDKEGKIIALGNPVENESIKRVYMNIITGEESRQPSESPLTINKNKTDLGTIPPRASRKLEFLVRNSGEDTIRVESITTPCECLSVTVTDINPYSTGIITVEFDSSLTKGAFHYPIVVRYEGVLSPLILHLYGMVSL